jgi:hypothetical protein
MRYSDYKCFRFEFDSGVAFVSINHPPINLLDEVLSQEFDRLGNSRPTTASGLWSCRAHFLISS